MGLLLSLEQSSKERQHALISNGAFPNTKKAGKFDVLHLEMFVSAHSYDT
jgi:hypothetical protein